MMPEARRLAPRGVRKSARILAAWSCLFRIFSHFTDPDQVEKEDL
jgi:hypothetical protein